MSDNSNRDLKQRKVRKREVFIELLSWIPEIIVWPIRLVLWIFRDLGKLFDFM
ncbi:hypothetical protein KO561_14315 [Radiobacillus kanasensis]|uniref:hypothetical protein n=1 Tax=Radiobacillus kanasensis TaxID=2844358 RepID=UPI001E2EC440|nr:hypothetical protein [Radiobacillus kanasensis]UFT98367.1 hypothetical protein KO561_14315 [Radiobacillus kanasensis]